MTKMVVECPKCGHRFMVETVSRLVYARTESQTRREGNIRFEWPRTTGEPVRSGESSTASVHTVTFEGGDC